MPTSHIPQELLVDVSRAVPDCTLVTSSAGHDVHEYEPDTFAETVVQVCTGAQRLSGTMDS